MQGRKNWGLGIFLCKEIFSGVRQHISSVNPAVKSYRMTIQKEIPHNVQIGNKRKFNSMPN